MRGKVVIAGVCQTKFGKLVGRTPVSMNVEACRKALNEAGVSNHEVDAVLVKYPTSKFQTKFGQCFARPTTPFIASKEFNFSVKESQL